MENRSVKIGEAAKNGRYRNLDAEALEETGERLPARKTKGGTRSYAVSDLLGLQNADAPTGCYAHAFALMTRRKTLSASKRCLKRTVQPKAGAPRQSKILAAV